MDRIVINTAEFSRVIRLSSIVYCRAQGSYTHLYLTNKRTISCSRNLTWLEREIKSKKFLRIHRSYLVNLNHVDKIIRKENKLVLSMGIELPVAFRKMKSIKEILK